MFKSSVTRWAQVWRARMVARPRAAIALAKEIPRFPQLCMRADRASAYAGWSKDLDDALKSEARRGAPVVSKEARAGAARFASGKGRGGDFGSI